MMRFFAGVDSAVRLVRRGGVMLRRFGWRGLGARVRRKLFPPRVYGRDWRGSYAAEALTFAETFDCSAEDLRASRVVTDDLGRVDVRTVVWFLPGFAHAFYGGVHTILRFADGFTRYYGVRNTFVIVDDGVGVGAAGYQARIGAAFPGLGGAQVCVVSGGQGVVDLPPADVCVATLWSTAYEVLRFNRTRRKCYFIQDFEPMFYPAGSISAQIEATYRFGFYGLTNTVTLRRVYEGEYEGCASSFDPCVDGAVFFPPPDRDWGDVHTPFTVFFYARPDFWRNGFELGAMALRVLKQRLGARVRVVSAGQQWDPADYGLAGVVENVGLLSYRETAELYRRCDVGLVMMFTRHPSYLPFELMASGCLVVSNVNSATRWFLRDGENCLLALPSASCLAETIARGLMDGGLRREVVERAYVGIQAHFMDWDRQIMQVYAAMCDPAGKRVGGDVCDA